MENTLELNEEELTIKMLCDSVEADNIWQASHKIKSIIKKFYPISSPDVFALERDDLEVFALKILAKRYHFKEQCEQALFEKELSDLK